MTHGYISKGVFLVFICTVLLKSRLHATTRLELVEGLVGGSWQNNDNPFEPVFSKSV